MAEQYQQRGILGAVVEWPGSGGWGRKGTREGTGNQGEGAGKLREWWVERRVHRGHKEKEDR